LRDDKTANSQQGNGSDSGDKSSIHPNAPQGRARTRIPASTIRDLAGYVHRLRRFCA
jgi:hypothetical protein